MGAISPLTILTAVCASCREPTSQRCLWHAERHFTHNSMLSSALLPKLMHFSALFWVLLFFWPVLKSWSALPHNHPMKCNTIKLLICLYFLLPAFNYVVVCPLPSGERTQLLFSRPNPAHDVICLVASDPQNSMWSLFACHVQSTVTVCCVLRLSSWHKVGEPNPEPFLVTNSERSSELLTTCLSAHLFLAPQRHLNILFHWKNFACKQGRF